MDIRYVEWPGCIKTNLSPYPSFPSKGADVPKTAQDSNDFYRAGLIQTSSSAQELENHLRAGLDIGPPPGFEDEFDSILARHSITSEAPAQKNTRVINFLAELAASGATKPTARVGAA